MPNLTMNPPSNQPSRCEASRPCYSPPTFLANQPYMAFVRSPRGAKSVFNVARVSSRISRVYVDALGSKTANYRLQIQQHVKAIALSLRVQFGEGDHIEWSRAAITATIEEELRRNAPMEVHETFLEQIEKSAQPAPDERVSRWEEMSEANPDRIDPAWTIQLPPEEQQKQVERPPALADLGEPARKTRKASGTALAVAREEPSRRTHWIEFWRGLAQSIPQALDFDAFERLVLRLPPDQKHLDPTGWWIFWQQRLDDAMRLDPRIVGLLQAAHDRKKRAEMCGQNWLAGSGLTGAAPQLFLSQDGPGHQLYRQLWKEHLRRLALSEGGHPSLVTDFDLNKLAQALRPERDRAIDWRGHQWLDASEALLPVGTAAWENGAHPRNTREMPQWAWMRVAMALSIQEKNPTTQALQFYAAFSSLAVIPSETMLREAGKLLPRYLEDEAGVVEDEFEAIHQAMHRAAVGTKWTGTVALDWRTVRAHGALIAGRRYSQGPMGFLRSIDSSLAAQGRSGEDRPVTVSLPLWHRDIEGFLDLRKEGSDRLQSVVTIPDIFFERLQKGEPWLLLDPAAYPELLEDRHSGYERAEERWKAEGKKNTQTAKAIGSERLWKRLMGAMERGSPFLTFEDSDRAFAPFPETAPPVGGIDGVGALPIPRDQAEPFLSWPAMAVDLSRTLNKEGSPDPDSMKQNAALAMRALDNAIDLSGLPATHLTLAYRPVCLGAVGFYEAINRGTANSHTDPELVKAWVSVLAESWATAVLTADQQLRKERGAAPAWDTAPDATPFSPMNSMDRLRASRKGSLGIKPKPRQPWPKDKYKQGHRCSVRVVWAPYQGAAKIAGVTPGGIGTLRPVEQVLDEQGRLRWCPTPLLLDLLRDRPEELETLRNVLRNPTNPRRWPEKVQQLVFPDAEGWELRLVHAAYIRPWVDQGISITLPAGMKAATLSTLVYRAWWLGLSNVRLEGLSPDSTATEDGIPSGSMDNEANYG